MQDREQDSRATSSPAARMVLAQTMRHFAVKDGDKRLADLAEKVSPQPVSQEPLSTVASSPTEGQKLFQQRAKQIAQEMLHSLNESVRLEQEQNPEPKANRNS